MTIQLTHFSAAFVFALFASIVFGITHRETTREMVRYGLYCFAMFLGGAAGGGMGDVAGAEIAARFYPSHTNASNTRFDSKFSRR